MHFMDDQTYDVTVVGGGPAGLQAALTLGRMHRRVLLLDSGRYRNDPTGHLHNFLTRDGTPPAELRAVARAELAAYPSVTVRDAAADEVKPDGDDFRIHLADGSTVASRLVLLATGVRDTLPDKPGLAELFGDVVAHCPRAGIGVRTEVVAGVCRSSAGARVSFAEGPDEEIGGLFVGTAFAQAAPFAEQLGLALLGSGCIEIDPIGRTSMAGVYAAGDLAHTAALPMPLASVLTAAAAGQVAATACDSDLLARDHGVAAPV
jgi:thioredoxin reductase